MTQQERGDVPYDWVFLLFVPARQRIADDTACRATQNTLQAREVIQIEQAAVTAHELDPRASQSSVLEFLIEPAEEPVEVLPQDRCQIGVGRG